MSEIIFEKIEDEGFTGRNGCFKSSGLLIDLYGKSSIIPSSESFVRIRPITSKGKEANCHIDIPQNSLKETICALIKLYEKSLK